MNCGCFIETHGNIEQIIYCPLHDAAAETLEALKAAVDEMDHLEKSDKMQYFDTEELKAVIAKAEADK